MKDIRVSCFYSIRYDNNITFFSTYMDDREGVIDRDFFFKFFSVAKSHYLHYLQYGLNTSVDNTAFYLQYSAYWLLTFVY